MSWQEIFHLEGDLERLGSMRKGWHKRRKIGNTLRGFLIGMIVTVLVLGIVIFWMTKVHRVLDERM